MMNKKLLFLTLVLGIGFISCQDKNDDSVDGLVDVSLTTTQVNPITKSQVNSGGFTFWDPSDIVYVVDANGVPRPFTNDSESSLSQSKFTGKLLANHGTQTYYAYHAALKSPCDLNGTYLTVSRENLAYYLDDETKANKKGEYCSMIAIPLKFDAQDASVSKNFNFYHVNCLIEARIYPDVKSDNLAENEKLVNMEFDKVEFTMKVTDPLTANHVDQTPFNTKVTFDMSRIIVTDPVKKTVQIPFTDGSGKVNMITSTITYAPGTKFSDRLTDGEYYDIPIYALPTESWFSCQMDVIFYNGIEKVYHVRKKATFDGLALAGLNDPNFEYKTDRVVEP